MAHTVPRPGWLDLPPPIRSRISELVGARVLGWSILPPGATSSIALQLQTSERKYVVTAVNSDDPMTLRIARRGIAVAQELPQNVPAPRLDWFLDEDFGQFGHWIVASWILRRLRPVADDWTQEEVAAALRLIREVGEIEDSYQGEFFPATWTMYSAEPWEHLAAERPDGLRSFSPWLEPRMEALAEIAAHTKEAVAGPFLSHGAPNRDTLFLPHDPGHHGMAVDWFRASRGAAFVDVILLLVHIRAEGGPAPEVVLARHPLPPGTDPDAVTCFVTALAGFLIQEALTPGYTRTDRRATVQQASARVCVEWLRRRLGF